MATKQDTILGCSQLAAVLGITEEEAAKLMRDKKFPATRVGDDSYVVLRDLLEVWIKDNARTTSWNITERD